jgi:hypothetical protein
MGVVCNSREPSKRSLIRARSQIYSRCNRGATRLCLVFRHVRFSIGKYSDSLRGTE